MYLRLLAIVTAVVGVAAASFLGVSLLRVDLQDEQLVSASALTLANYYFNQDGDSSGPYNLAKARFYYTEALKQDPLASKNAWYQLGRVDFIEGRLDAAVYKFNKQIEHFGDSIPNVYYMLGLTYGYMGLQENRSGAWEKAEEAFLKFIEYAPTAPWPRVDLAWVYFSQGKYEEMIPLLEEGLRHYPEQPWLLNTYGLALLNTDRKEEAKLVFARALEGAANITTEEWGRAYSGNDPKTWKAGLEEFRASIEYNLSLASS